MIEHIILGIVLTLLVIAVILIVSYNDKVIQLGSAHKKDQETINELTDLINYPSKNDPELIKLRKERNAAVANGNWHRNNNHIALKNLKNADSESVRQHWLQNAEHHRKLEIHHLQDGRELEIAKENKQ